MGFNEYISELLFEHNCVIVPGFGGLVANTEKARINTLTHQIHPACKTIAFNRNLNQNDGLLANHIVRKLHVSYDEAIKQIAEYTANISRELKENNSYSLPGVGDFFLNRENSIQFVPAAGSNYLYASYGLQPLSLPGQAANSETLILNKGNKGRSKNLQWIASSAAAMLILAACIFSFKAGLFKLNHQIVTLNPFDTLLGNSSQEEFPAETTTVIRSVPQVIGQPEETASVVPENTEAENSASEEVVIPHPAPAYTANSAEGRKFYIIGGAFHNKAFAKRYMNFLTSKGYSADLAGENNSGLTRVSYESFTDSLQAAARLEFIKSNENQSAWILAQ